MLAGSSLGDDALLPETDGQQCLANRVVDLVRPSVGKVLPLQVDVGSARVLGQAGCEVEGRGAADKVLSVPRHFGNELGIVFDNVVLLIDFPERLTQCFVVVRGVFKCVFSKILNF